MLKIKIRVTFVDLFAFCGREQHPEPSDVGQEGLLLSMRSEQLEPEGSDPSEEEAEAAEDLSEDYPGQHISGPDFDTRDREGREEDGPLALQVLVCKLANGRTVELLGHEVELLSASHDGDLGFSEAL